MVKVCYFALYTIRSANALNVPARGGRCLVACIECTECECVYILTHAFLLLVFWLATG